ncbi:cytochrome c-type biogenesis CcmF C-terminal domain-containing protein [Blastococcus sp. BMG 814]|uniref:Cytochrome c-type biogenesis CcmF C-terminal domain-containing protein n=1 Tax=Blastococcus carthaginiensis TaxID=3050034 RepID=A0ABT9I8B5_9ACTN|nr:cytochrome c-type biogenesis CcmF C-terminal domain-containing protein [Blastococcus carthaginiensis]MDP5181803.1 cytochrome c-type biogenesis CcmF C-terminal domain-containing protein [Blastococcus carthaginiensis]
MRYLLGPGGLALTLVCSSAATVAWAVAGRGGDRPARFARLATQAALFGAALAVAAMVTALVQHDFSIRYVAENGGRAVPTYYTVISLWAALEGSLLLWLLVLTGFTVLAVVRVHPRAGALHPWAMAVLSSLSAFFAGLALFAGNAFDRVSPVPADGPGPNPLLQDHPLMGIHPPLLYLGFVGMAVPFAYAVAALITGRTGPAWVAAVRGWTLVAWTFLTVGVVMGGWWAYEVLGWGGYWGWDPVENVSVLPWFTATALLHSIMVQRRRPTLRLWNLTLAIATFVLVVFGTFLTRSGVVESVHAFTRSAIGPVLLAFLLALVLGAGLLLVWRSDRLRDEDPLLATVSRETSFLANNLLLAGLAFTILLGTTFPILLEAVTGDRTSVGPPYFNRMTVPLALLVVLLMGVGPLLPWGRAHVGRLGRVLLPATLAGAATVGVLGLAGLTGVSALLTFGLAVFVTVATGTRVALDVARARALRPGPWAPALGRTLVAHRRGYGGLLVHLGFVLAAVAVAASSTYGTSATQQLTVGETVRVGGWTATLEDLRMVPDARRISAVADLRLREDGADAGVYSPMLSSYPTLTQAVGTPSVRTTLTEDAYLVLTEIDADAGTATVRLAVNPLVLWLWVSVGVMAAGALVAGWPRRRREEQPPPERPGRRSPAVEVAA